MVGAPVEHHTATVNGVELHYAVAGQGPLIVFLHGFPEFWYAWNASLAEFSSTHRAVAPDMRGYNLSAKPGDLEAYEMPQLVADVAALIRHLGHEKAIVVGHDWGGAVAWAFALKHPEMLDKLIIINAPHPAIFYRELASNPAQQRASQYMNLFRSAGAEAVLSANGFAPLMQAVFISGWASDEDKAAYLEAWKQPGALTGGLNYYRANIKPEIPQPGGGNAPPAEAPGSAVAGTEVPPIDTPTLVIWGEKDTALLTGNLDGIEEYVNKLTVRRIPDGTHWVVHEKPAEVHRLMRAFLKD